MLFPMVVVQPPLSDAIPGMPAIPQTAQAASADNQTLMQYFEWYLPGDGNHWNRMGADAQNLANMGITGVWIPPAYKGGAGTFDVGYGVYDVYDLGEFNQKGTVRTKYGTKAQLQNAITQLHNNGVEVYLDVVMNHKGGADALETVSAHEVDWNDRNRVISGNYPIGAWTKFTFPGRGNTHSSFKWDASHFNGVDWNDTLKVNRLYKFEGRYWDWEVDTEKANFDYLMFADIDFDNPQVVSEMENWGVWVTNELNLDGFRLDAVKHIKFDAMKNWLNNVRTRTGKNLFTVGEYWSGSTGALNNYLNKVGYNMNLFDVDLHYRFYSVGANNGSYDLRNLLGGTLSNTSMFNSVTFVDNHDSQPGQGLSSWVEPWFKPQSYAFIMTRREGIPTLFYGDYYGIPNNNIAPMKPQLDPILQARKTYAYGPQHDYLDHWDVIGWTREGEAARPNSGLATIISDGAAGNKWMYVGTQHAGEVWKDLTGNRTDTVSINADGWGDFQVNSRSVSIWVKGEAIVNDTAPPTVPTGLDGSMKTDTTITLKWTPSTDQSGVAGYDVFRNGVKIGYTTTSSYTDYSLSPSSSYSYTVKAIDLKNNVSASTAPLSVTTNALSGKLITIYYKKGFTKPYIHYRPAGGTWTVAPGLVIPDAELTGYGKFVVSTLATNIEVAFNDGGTNWDSNNSKNYLFYPGTWTYTPGANNVNGTIKNGDPNAAADTTAPTVPSGLTVASKTDKTVNFTWTASTDAVGVAGYEVSRNGTVLGTTATNSYTDSGLSPGTSYSYTLKAFDGSGNYSTASTALAVTTNTVAVNNKVTIYYKRGFSNPYIVYRPVGGNWVSSPVVMKSSEISGYNKITVSIGEATTLEATFFNGTSTWDNNDGKNYLFEMGTRTYTPGALSSPGVIISGTPTDVSNPTRPSGVKASSVSFSTVSLVWNPSSDNKGVVAYDVFRDGKRVGSSTTTSFTDIKLTSGTKYAYRVAARDAVGNVSSASSSISVNTATIDIQPPTTPIDLTTTAITSDSVSLSWLPSSDNDIVKGYDVYRDDKKVGFTETTSYTDSGLLPASTYSYKVVALDAIPNLSAPSAPLSVTTVSSGSSDTLPPSAPSSLTVAELAADSFTVTWSAAIDNDSGVKEYEVYDNGVKVAVVTGTTYSMNGLKEFSEHLLIVKAVDFAGNVSVASESLLVRTQSNFSGISLSTNSIAENSPINTVIGSLSGIGIGSGQSVSYQLVAGVDDEDNANFNIVGSQLRNSQMFDFETKPQHKIRVRGTDANGAVIEQTFIIVVTDLDDQAPSAPSAVSASAITDKGFQLQWTAATDNTAVTGYRVLANGTLIGTSQTTQFTASDLLANTNYAVTVQASDAAGNISSESTAVTVKTSVPAVQNNVTIYYKRGFNNPNIHYRPEGGAWTTVPGVAMQASEFAGYSKITINIGSANRLEACFNEGGTVWDSNNTLNYMFNTGISTYTPSNTGGAGTITAGAPFVDTEAPSEPTSLIISDATFNSGKLSWQASTDNVAVVAYDITLNGTKVAQVPASTLTYSFTGLTPVTTYTIRVKALDAANNQSAESSASTITLTTLEAPPPNTVTIYYKKGFATPYVHYRPDGGVWSTAPGVAIPASELEGYHKIVIDIGQATKLTAVFNDGSTQWDNNNGLDYVFPAGVSTYIPATSTLASVIRSGMPIADTEAPTIPTELSVSAITHNGLTLSWSAATDNVAVASYEIYLDGMKVATVAGNVLTYKFTDLAALTLYSFSVKAIDDADNRSELSAALEMKTTAIPPSNKVTIYYKKGFATPYIHYQPEGGAWTATPGVALTASEFDGYHKIVIDIAQASKMSAVFNDGGTIWDNNNTLNYMFTPGVYRFIPGANGSPGTIVNGPPVLNKVTIYYKRGFTTPYIHYQPEGGNWTTAPGIAIPEIDAVGYNKIDVNLVDVTKMKAVFNNGGSIWDNNNGLEYTFNAGISTFVPGANGSPGTITEGMPVLSDIEVPSSPTNLVTTTVTATGLKLSWTASTDNVGVIEYEVYQNGVSIGKTSETNLLVSGLTSITTYELTVQAIDAAGNKSAMSAIHSVTTLDNIAPSAPENVTATNVTTSGFLVNWTESTDNVGVTKYEIYNGTKLLGTTNVTSFTASGLLAGTNYTLTVFAVDAADNKSGASVSILVSTLQPPDTTVPTTPTNLVSSNVKTSGFRVSWTASTDNVGVTGYNVYRNGAYVATVTSPSYTFSGLVAGTTYSVTVLAYDAAKNRSVLSAPLLVSTSSSGADTTAPTTPTNLASSNVTTSGFRVSWTASTDNVGVTGYNVYRNGAYVATVTSPSYTFSGLVAGTSYSVTVLAYDAAKNRSVLSAPLTVSTSSSGADTTAPTTSTNLVSSNVTTSGFRVSWTASTDNVGVTGYNVYRNGAYVATVTSPSYTFSGLVAGTTYSVTVLAYDAAKNRSKLSAPLSVSTSLTGGDTLAPTTPTNLVSSNVTTSGFRVSWTASTDNVAVTGYNVYRNGVYLVTVTSPSYTFSGLVAGTSYSVTVLAYDAAKNRSVLSVPLLVTTLP
jgi:chitodextrinase/glycosidase